MSLINQALRKAQQDRTPKNVPDDQSSAPRGSMPTPKQRLPLSVVIGLVSAIAILVVLVVGLSLLLLRGEPEKTQTTAPTPSPTPAPAMEAPELMPLEEPALPEQPAQEPSFATTPSIDALSDLRAAREAAEAKLAEEENAAAKGPDIVEWLTQSRINAVRISPSGSKVILNGNDYTQGEYVNFELGLKVLAIEQERVLFEDKSGKKYLKRL